jgi:hypothetical protein
VYDDGAAIEIERWFGDGSLATAEPRRPRRAPEAL